MSTLLESFVREKNTTKKNIRVVRFIVIRHFDIPNYKPSNINGYRSFTNVRVTTFV